MFIFKTHPLGNLFHAQLRLRQQIAGAHKAQLQQILMRTGSSVLLERVAESAIAHIHLSRERLCIQAVF